MKNMIGRIIVGWMIFTASLIVLTNQTSAQQIATSFEKAAPGSFTSLKTEVGVWNNAVGKVQINRDFAKSGKQCLHLAGGERSSIELRLIDAQTTGAELVFSAERWTVRQPFSFRIESQLGERWTEIYKGDESIKVGKRFLSKVRIPLGNTPVSKLRFITKSPANTGVLIDDLAIRPARPQTLKTVEVVPITLPVLIHQERCPLLKVRITTEGSLNPISLQQIQLAMDREAQTSLAVNSLTAIYTGNQAAFSQNASNVEYGRVTLDDLSAKVTGDQKLSEGENYLWICAALKPEANIDQRIRFRGLNASFSNGKTIDLEHQGTPLQLGIALRQAGDDQVNTFRIPGLVTTKHGTLIGVYDVRHDRSGDLPGNIDVGMSRSTDGGRTWQTMKIIMDMGNDPKWLGDGIGDPSILVDRETGTLWVSATWSHGNRSWNGSGPGLDPQSTGQWMLAKSEDDGITWSAPINITSQVKKPEWSFLLQGPGKGITMADGTLVFPAQYQDPPNPGNKEANRLPHSTFIYSRDHGQTWACATAAYDDTTESQIVELSDGELMLNCRFNRQNHRVVTTTTDLGKSWRLHSTNRISLREPRSCMASLINVGRELDAIGISGGNKEMLLFSNPDSVDGRNHITIKASLDGGKTWPEQHQLLLDEQTGRGYSCMTMIDRETIGILYESSQSDLAFQRIKVKDVLNPPEDQKTRNHTSSNGGEPHLHFEGKRSGKLSLARIFDDHMVIQAKKPIRFWGTAPPLQGVSIRFAEQVVQTRSSKDGKWLAELAPVDRYLREGQTVNIACGTDTLTLEDILVGEVWFCAGQSNMAWPLNQTDQGNIAIRQSLDNQLRLLDFSGKVSGDLQAYDHDQFANLSPARYATGRWVPSTAETTPGFSAVGYYFGRQIRDHLECPVGIINVAVGGTPIEAWLPIEIQKSDDQLQAVAQGFWLDNPLLHQWCRMRGRQNLQRGLDGEIAMAGDSLGPNHPFKPGFMFQSSTAPFRNLSIAGLLWYQGESNASNLAQCQRYAPAFQQLVKSWRHVFADTELPIGFVQLPGIAREFWPHFREIQRRSQADLIDVGMAITIDIGHPSDVHPRNKRPVGKRLAAWALAAVYHKDQISSGPLLIDSSITNQTIRLTFQHCGQGLKTNDDKKPRHFEVASTDGQFYPAEATIVGPQVIDLTSSKVKNPVFARYAWHPFPKPGVNLFNSAGLPASPFTTEEDLQ